ncbi:MAG: helix-turn-helix transcriptional regulator [Victivallales bacterium]|nr:helix-turn-helix transcriptional regulator [Victivallales bacterium]
MHHVVISAYENGKRKLTRKAAVKLAKALDEDPESFFKNIPGESMVVK